jgi:hypothetical protein
LAVGLTLAVLAALAAVLVPPALENAGENRENQRRAAAANLEEIRRTLIEDQRPRRATLSLVRRRPARRDRAPRGGERDGRRTQPRERGNPRGPYRTDELSPGRA